jgi:hypothetical protein
MSRFRRYRPSGSMLVALLALVMATTGSAVAASFITSKQIKDGTILTKDISKKAQKALKGRTGAKGPIGATGAAGAPGAKGDTGAAGPKGDTGAKGDAGAAGADGTAVAYARIQSNGTVDAAQSKGITQAMVAHPGTGNYCISGLGFTPKSAIGSPQFIHRALSTFVNNGSGYIGCTGTDQVSVAVYDDGVGGADAASDSPFMIMIN